MSSQRLLIIGAVLGIITVALLSMYLRQYDAEQRAVKVYRLAPGASLAKGDKVLLRADVLETVELPAKFDGLLKTLIPADSRSAVWISERAVTRDIEPGTLLMYEHFEESLDERFSARIEAGKRAITIPVDAAAAVAYFVRPGSRVDILATLAFVDQQSIPLPGGGAGVRLPRGARMPADLEVPTEKISTKTLLQNVRILAVGRATMRGDYLRESDAGFNTVTVEVTSLQAEKLVFAMEHARGSLVLALRNPSDGRAERLPAVGWDTLDQIE